VGTVVHELIHTLGFAHEQNRLDRDDYVKIHFQNIEPGEKHNFEIDSAGWQVGIPYDYHSIMHYHSTAFSVDGKLITIEPKLKGVQLLGRRVGMTKLDVQGINRLYKCFTKENSNIYG